MSLRKLALAALATASLALPLAAPAAANNIDAWGSIAVNLKIAQTGTSAGAKTKRSARKAALKNCPGKCRPALFVRNKCGALGVRKDGKLVAGFDRHRRPAIKETKKKARKSGKLLASVCSG